MVRNGHNVFFNMVRNGHMCQSAYGTKWSYIVSICICHDMVRNGHNVSQVYLLAWPNGLPTLMKNHPLSD
jgi:hypothetical protein